MYLVLLGFIGLFVLISLFDRGVTGLALIGIVVLLALLVKKVRQLTALVSGMEAEIGLLKARTNADDRLPQSESGIEQQTAPESVARAADTRPASDLAGQASPESVASTASEPGPVFEAALSGPSQQRQADEKATVQGKPASRPTPQDSVAAKIMSTGEASSRVVTATTSVTDDHQDSQRPPPGQQPRKREPTKRNWFDRGLQKAVDAAEAWITGGRVSSRVVTATTSVTDDHQDSQRPPPGQQLPPPGQQPPKREPPKRNWFDRGLQKVIDTAWAWITGGNIFVRVGIIILFMGMTFLIRYAIGQNMIPIELRLAIVGGVAIALLIWGWKQREKKGDFALVIQGGGIGLLYLTIFASFSLYRVLDSLLAFAMLGIIVILAAIMSVLQNARSLALFAAIGGFLAPILTSSGSNNYVGLFSYYTVLNIGIFAVAWFKSWRILNLTGFVFTFTISGVWGLLSYKPEYLSTTQPFLITFFLLYVGISILFALRRSINFKDTIDSSLVFGTPLLAFGMQCQLVGDFEYGIAISAFSLAAFYLCMSFVLWRIFSTRLSLLCETFLSLAVIFATLAIPFAIDGSLTGSIWALEGAGILWVSIRQQQFYRRLFAVGLMLAAGAISGWEIIFSTESLFFQKAAFLNSAFIGTTLIAISAAIGSWLLSPAFDGKRGGESKIEYGLLAYSTIVLLVGFGVQILMFEMFRAQGHLLALLAVVTGLLYVLGAERLNWKSANWMSLGFFALLIPAALLSFSHQERLSEYHGYLLWPIATFALFNSLKSIRSVVKGSLSIGVHFVAAALLAMLLFWEGIWQLLVGFSILSVVFCKLGDRFDWRELRLCSILFLPALVLCFGAAIAVDGNLVTLSSIGSEIYPPVQPGGILWPLAFATYFYLLLKNSDIGGRFVIYYYLGGALLIATMLLWLGLWPLLLGATVLCWLAYYLAWQYQWVEMRLLSKLLFPLMVVIPIVGLINGVTDPVNLISLNLDFDLGSRSGFFLWPLAFVTLVVIYWLSEKEKKPALDLTHALSLLFLVAITTWEISQLGLDLVRFYNAWHLVLLPIVGLFAIKSILKADRWPFNRYREGYERYALLPLALGTLLWSFLQFASSGKDSPLIWIPLLNPIDLMQCLILFGWFTHGREKMNNWFGLSPQHSGFILAGFVFLWINVDILRFVHHWTGISWDYGRLIQADLTQTLMSLVWSIMGLIGTFLATRKERRQLWIVSALLLAVVVLKLFVVDLSAQDTIERIVSFTGVGLLLTFVGYFSPIPPKQKLQAGTEQ